ncbi:MAG TPA: hypothetical protein VHG92_14380 [Afifellaceae bacterium]|nr:hypothetical protein [Afifellaceae bacterium]
MNKMLAIHITLATVVTLSLLSHAAQSAHLGSTNDLSISEAIQLVTDCAVAEIERLDESRISVELLARRIEPLCEAHLVAAVELACHDQDEAYCDAVQEILDPKRLYPEIVLQFRAYTRRRPNS